MKGGFLYYVAGLMLVLVWLLYFLLLHDPVVKVFTYVGWVILAVGLILVFLPILVLQKKGKPEQGKDFAHTTTVVDSGIYAVVRHPLYLGWLLMYVAAILLSQHWLIVIMGILGIACMYLISRQEDQRLIEKFGDDYKRYMQKVPRMNPVAGVMQLLRHKYNEKREAEDEE